MGFLGLRYRRPAAVQTDSPRMSQDTLESFSDASLSSVRSLSSAGIPDALSFDKIMEGGTCPPCTVRDFLNYLIYIEHSAENLQFYLWLESYRVRFPAATTADLSLSPEWTQEMQDQTFNKLQKEHREGLKRKPSNVAAVVGGTDFEKGGNTTSENDPFGTPPRTPAQDTERVSSNFGSSVYTGTSGRSQAAEAFTAAGIKPPASAQPFREEVARIVTTYIVDDAPRQLNLSSRERKQLLTALSQTTHPTAFRQVGRSVESTLRLQAHPNFIRWSICNGNQPRVVFANMLGAFLIVGSLLAWILLSLSSAARGYRAIPAIGMVLGVSTQVAALKGMCVVLHGMHQRHVRPWELFEEEDVVLKHEKGASVESLSSFGSSNSYEDEPWVVKYEKRNLVRKVFDREVWVQEPALRSIQDTIFVQAMLLALVSSGVLTAVFVCVPGGQFF